MLYLISQVLLILVIATILGFLIGWILRKFKAARKEEELNSRLQQSELTITPIKTALSQVENEIAARDRSLNKLQKKYDDVKSRLPAAKAEVDRLSAKVGESDGSVKQLTRSLDDKDRELNRLGTELGQEKADLRKADLALNEAQGKRSVLESRLAEMKARLDDYQSTAERARTESSGLQRELNALQLELNDTKHKKDADISELKSQLAIDNAELKQARESKAEASAAAAKACQKLESVKEALAQKDTEHKLATTELEALQREIELLKSQQHTLQSYCDATSLKLETAMAERLRLSEQKNTDHSTATATIAKLETEISRLQDDLHKGTRQQKALEKEADAINAKLEKKVKALAMSEKDIQRLEQKVAILESQLENQRAQAQKTAADLQQQLSASNAARVSSEARCTELESSVQELTQKLNNKITDTKIADNQQQMLEADISALEKEVGTLDTDAKTLRAELQKSNKKHTNTIEKLRIALAEKDSASGDNANIQQQLNELQRTHKALEKEHQNTLKAADNKISDLNRELDKNALKVKTAHDEAIDSTRASESALRDKIADLNKQITELSGQLTLANREDARNQKDITALKAEISELRKEIANLKALLKKQEAAASSANTQAQSAAEINRKLENKLQRTQKQLQESIEKSDASKGDSQRTRQNLESKLKDDIANLKQQLAASSSDLKLAHSEERRSNKEIADLKSRLTGLDQELSTRAAALSKQEVLASQSSQKSQASVALNKQLEKELADTKRKLDTLKKASQKAAKEAAAKHTTTESRLKAEIDQLKARLSDSDSELKLINRDEKKHQSELAEIKATHRDLEARLTTQSAELARQESKASKYADKAQVSGDQVKQLKKQLANAQSQLAKTERDAASDLANNKSKTTAAALKLTGEIDQLKRKLATSEGELKLVSRDDKKQKAEIAELKDTIKNLDAHLAQQSEALQKRENLAAKDAAKASNAIDNNKQLKDDLADARKQLAAAERAANTSQQKLQKLKASDKSDTQWKARRAELDKLLANAIAEKTALARDLKSREKEVERLIMDAKLSTTEQRALAKEAAKNAAKLDKTESALAAEKEARAELQSDARDLMQELESLQNAEQDYLGKIEDLQLQIALTHKQKSTTMTSRIKELESMLAAEKRKASALQQPISIANETIGISTTMPKKAANTSTKRRKKKAS